MAPRQPQGGPRKGIRIEKSRSPPQETPRRLQEASERPPNDSQEALRRPEEASQEGPERQNSLIFIGFFRCFSSYRFSGAPTLQDRPRGCHNGSKTALGGRKRVPRRPNNASRRPHSRPRKLKGFQEGPKRGPKRGIRTEISRSPPQDTSRRPQEASERPPKGPKRRLNRPEQGPKRLPARRLRDGPRRPQEGSKTARRPQEGSKTAHEHAKSVQKVARDRPSHVRGRLSGNMIPAAFERYLLFLGRPGGRPHSAPGTLSENMIPHR